MCDGFGYNVTEIEDGSFTRQFHKTIPIIKDSDIRRFGYNLVRT